MRVTCQAQEEEEEAIRNSVCMQSPEVFWETWRQVEADGQPLTETLKKKQGKSFLLEMGALSPRVPMVHFWI